MKLYQIENGRLTYGEALVKRFLAIAGNSLDHFRYYDKHDIGEALRRHLVTVVGFDDEQVVAYGHINPEHKTHSLGVCVADGRTGEGLGGQLIELLLSVADECGIDTTVAVDFNNLPAQRFYKRFGFVLAHDTIGNGRGTEHVMRLMTRAPMP